MSRVLAAVLLLALAGCGSSGSEAPMTIDGVSPEENGTLEPDASMNAPADVAPGGQVAPAATMEPGETVQPDTARGPR